MNTPMPNHPQTAHSASLGSPNIVPDDAANFLTPREAAELLEISLATFKRRVADGLYLSTDVGGKRLYEKNYLERRKMEIEGRRSPETAIKSPPPSVVRSNAYDPDTVSRVFREFRKDQDLLRIVEELGFQPAVIRALHVEWLDLIKRSGGIYISADAVKTIDALQLDGFPISNGDELAAALTAIAETSKPCASCKENPRRAATLCLPCERELIQRKTTKNKVKV